MAVDVDRRRVSANIRRHCDTLGLKAECPFDVRHPSGVVVTVAAYLPQFGSDKGLLVDTLTGPAAPQRVAAKHSGLPLSEVNPEYLDTLEGFLEALRDWGYFGEQADLSKSLQETFFIFRSDG